MIRPPPISTLFPYTTLFRSGRHLCEHSTVPERVFQGSGHRRFVRSRERLAELALGRLLCFLEEHPLARLELQARICQLPVGDSCEMRRSHGVAFEQAEACEPGERVRHYLLEAQLERDHYGALEPLPCLLEVAGVEVVAAEVVHRYGRVLLVARFERERLLRHLDRKRIVAAHAGDMAEVAEHSAEAGRNVELAEEV